ncbi:MAG: hypothetical protein PHC61_00090 [Chitinivibrionales bacterium]|nr:hypothetical protein [Chitinivibrionales bacterium]
MVPSRKIGRESKKKTGNTMVGSGNKHWINHQLPGVVAKLERSVLGHLNAQAEDGLNLSGRSEICDILDDILAVLFPGYYSTEKVTKDDINFFLGDKLRHISIALGGHIKAVFRYLCSRNSCRNCTCADRAEAVLQELIESLPQIRAILLKDIQAAYDGDPAAGSLDEIIMSYPCIEAIATHRIAHLLYKLDVPIIPRIMSERAHSRTGIDIHPGATVGPRFFIDHGTGVVIGETTTIGANVKLYQGVTLGALSFTLDKRGKPVKGVKRHPDIEDDVVIYSNATILGGKTRIGKGSVIGGNTWITKSVPSNSKIYKT